jgi:hypothetical protein
VLRVGLRELEREVEKLGKRYQQLQIERSSGSEPSEEGPIQLG